MRVLVVDIGGTNVKLLVTGEQVPRKFPSGPTMTPRQMVANIKVIAGDWQYDVVAIGYPGQVRGDQIVTEPHNLGPGWVRFDFKTAFACPVRIINDAAMQALGGYKRGLLMFLGLGTGLGSALVVSNVAIPMELAHLSFKKGTYEDYIGVRALRRLGRKRWQRYVEYFIARMVEAVHPDDIVVGGGNAKKLKRLPEGCRLGTNANAFIGGFRMWEDGVERARPASAQTGRRAGSAA